MRSGALITLSVLAPNLIWMLFPGVAADKAGTEPRWLSILEHTGRLAVFIIPFFHSLHLHGRFILPALLIMLPALGLYYTCWFRYFAGGRTVSLLARPFMGIPLPMAVTPVVFLILSSYLLHSWPMLAASLLFGSTHIIISKDTLWQPTEPSST